MFKNPIFWVVLIFTWHFIGMTFIIFFFLKQMVWGSGLTKLFEGLQLVQHISVGLSCPFHCGSSASSRWPQPCQPQHPVASSKRPHKQGHERYKGLDRIRKGNRVNISVQHRQHQHANAHTAKDHLRVMLGRCGFSGSCANSFLRDSFKWSPHWWLIDLLARWFRI